MKTHRLTICVCAVLAAFACSGQAGPATSPDDDAPPRPAHGALSSVTAGERSQRPPAPKPTAKPAARADSDYLTVGFDQLAGFPFVTPPIQTDAPAAAPKADLMRQVPDAVKKLDGQKVVLTGFMLPTKIEQGLATEFMLLNSPMLCCFGVTPSTNAWVVVKMPKGAPPVQDVPLSFSGRLHVQEQWDNGWLSSIYQLDAESAVKPRT